MNTQIIAHGIDLVRIDRIDGVRRAHGERFLNRIFTAGEREYCLSGKNAAERLAGRFAAKEAVMKVLGTGWRGEMRWTDVETLPNALGQPLVTLHGAAAKLAESRGIARVLLSISHTREHAIASAIAVGGA
jgi:holo-[acyl-carrier protein] synthase